MRTYSSVDVLYIIWDSFLKVFLPWRVVSNDLVHVGDGDHVLGQGLVVGDTAVLKPVKIYSII